MHVIKGGTGYANVKLWKLFKSVGISFGVYNIKESVEEPHHDASLTESKESIKGPIGIHVFQEVLNSLFKTTKIFRRELCFIENPVTKFKPGLQRKAHFLIFDYLWYYLFAGIWSLRHVEICYVLVKLEKLLGHVVEQIRRVIIPMQA